MHATDIDDIAAVANKPLSQLKPFNPSIFDEVMGFYGQRYKQVFDQYEAMKLHVVIDVLHTLETGQPLIGGPLYAWDYGPVVSSAYQRISLCANGDATKPVEKIGEKGTRKFFRATAAFDEENFTRPQLAIFEKAWQLVKSMPFDRSQRYFHGIDNDNAIGYAWKRAKQRHPGAAKPPMDWLDILHGAEKLESLDVAHIRTLVEL